MKNRRINQERPLIFSKTQSGLLLRETKFNLKVLISENEDLRIEIQMMKESLKAYKIHLAEIGETRRDGKASSSVKTKSLLIEDNHELTYNATRIEQYLTSLNNQFSTDILIIVIVQIETMKRNIYEQKEAQIMILQSLLINIIEKKQEINMEYYDIDNKLVISFLDNNISGFRSDMAKMTKNLNLERSKGEKAMRKIEVIEA